MYARALGSYELLDYLKKSVIHANPSQEEIDACAPFFPENELADIIHAATCLYADAILITNDNNFNKIKNSGIVEVWSNTKAIKNSLMELTIIKILKVIIKMTIIPMIAFDINTTGCFPNTNAIHITLIHVKRSPTSARERLRQQPGPAWPPPTGLPGREGERQLATPSQKCMQFPGNP